MEIYVTLPAPEFPERSSFVSTVYFRDGNTATTPSAVKYRIDCLTTGENLKAWTSLTPGASINITVTASENAIQAQSNNKEKKQITVAAEPDTDGETRDYVTWKTKNIRGL